MSDPTLADLADDIQALVGRRGLIITQEQNWWSGTPTGGPNGDGLYPRQDSAGNITLHPCPEKIAADVAAVGPLHFGAIGDGLSHPASTVFATLADCQLVYPFAVSLAQEIDWLGHQKMINIFGKYFQSDRRTYKMSNADAASHTPLTWIAGLCTYDAGYSLFDWSESRAKVNATHLIPNYSFQNADGWANADGYNANQIVLATFGEGYASCVDNIDGSNPLQQGPYYEFYHPVTIPAGRWRVIWTAEMVQGESYDHGNGSTPYCFVHMTGGGISTTSSANPRPDLTNPKTTWVPFGGQFDFSVSAETASQIRIHAGGWATYRFLSFDLIPWPDDYAILNTRDGAPDHYLIPQRFKHAYLAGPGTASNFHGAVWKSFENLDGDCQDWEEVDVRNFARGVEWSDGAYLLNYYSCRILFNATAAYFGTGAQNAGENIRFYAGSLSGNTYGFDNLGGAEITLFGTPPDYGGAFCKNNAGTIRCIGLRHEQNHNPGVPIWHCVNGGRVIYSASFVLLAGNVGTADTPPALLDGSTTSLEFHATAVYNASSAAGVVATGAGRVVFMGHVNSGSPNNGLSLITEAPNQDIFGGAGLFSPQGFPSALSVDKSGIGLEGGVFCRGDRTVTDQWTSQDLAVDISTNYAKIGTRSLRIRKLGPADNTLDAELHILAPLSGIGSLLGRQFLLFPNPIAGWTETSGPPLYYRTFWVRKIGNDAYGRPIYSTSQVFKGEVDIIVPPAGSTDWIERGFNTSFDPPQTDETLQAGDRSPAWASHLLILFGLQSVPEMEIYLDDLRANFIG